MTGAYIKIDCEWMLHATSKLSDSETGRLFTAILQYAAHEPICELNGREAILWPLFVHLMESDSDTIIISKIRRGEQHPNWKGGITTENQKQRNSPEYVRWRKCVFSRDDYTCRTCGKHGGDLRAHHIKPFAKYADLRLDLSNGITLCEKCHRETHGR